MATTYPKFGANSGYQAASQASRFDQSEIVISNATVPYIRNGQVECYNVTNTCFWGTQPQEWHNFATFDEVVITVADEVLPDYIPNPLAMDNQDGEWIPKDFKQPFTILSCCQIIKAHVSIKLTGKISKNTDLKVGDTDLPDIKTAIGNFDISGLLGAIQSTDIKVVNIDNTDSSDTWSTAVVEWRTTISKKDGGKSIVSDMWKDVTSVACGDNGLSYNFCDTYAVEITLKSTDYAKVKCTRTRHLMQG